MHLMKLKETLDKIEKDAKFKEWKQENKKSYLSYAFCTLSGDETENWQLGYYSGEKDRMTTFSLADELAISPEEEVFKKEDMMVKEIDIGKIKLDLKSAIEKIKKLQEESYPKEEPIKKIIILQNLENLGNVWNITYITRAFNTLNIKLDAENGEVLSHKLSSIFSFRTE